MKLDMKKATAIRSLYTGRNHSIPCLAKRYGVTESSIRAILSNRSFYDADYDPKQVGFAQPKIRDLVSEVIAMRSQSKSYHEIGEELAHKYGRIKNKKIRAWSSSSVREALEKYGDGIG